MASDVLWGGCHCLSMIIGWMWVDIVVCLARSF